MKSTFDTAAAFARTRREIERHGRHQGTADSDDLPRWLIAWVWFNPQAEDQIGAVMECARRIGRECFTPADAEAVLEEEAASTPKQMKADELAKWLGVTYVERQKLGLTRIGAKDVGKRSRTRRFIVLTTLGACLEGRIRDALAAPGRPGLHKIAKQFGVGTGTVQRIAHAN